ncbi:MAG: hypothetical protein WCP60_09055 [bacterium]
MRQQQLLIILGVLALSAASFLGVLVYQTTHLTVITVAAPMPAHDSPHFVRSLADATLPENTSAENSLKQLSSEEAMTTSPDQATKQEEVTKPIFYEVRPSGLGHLSEDQQKFYAASQQEYMTFYSQWVNILPHDPETWNRKMTELQQDLATQIGPEGMDNLLR